VIRAGRDGAFAMPDLPGIPARMLAASAGYRHTRNGVIAVWRDPAAPDWSDSDKKLIEGIGSHLGIALAQIAQHEQLASLARTDGLTGLVNARTFRRILARRLVEARGGALVYVDLDNFKLVNDRHGHERGDAALQALALNLLGAVRVDDIVGRLGGDEFALWLDEVDHAALARVAARVIAIREALLPHAGAPDRPLSLSVGCVMVPRGAALDENALLARADAAMYRVKRGGKGNFVIETIGSDAKGAEI
jgi:diguanylate cyclase (GGDEF)-like protein